jgi:prepilin-type N-terminal cleavage/methylation domain-containing protein
MSILSYLSRKKGFTLAEILIGTGIFAIIMLLTVALFTSSWRHFQVANTRNDAQINAIRGMDRFYRDFEESQTSSLKLDNTAHVYYFLSARTQDGQYHMKPDGSPDWKAWLYYYLYPDAGTPPFKGQSFFLLARKYYSIPSFPPDPPPPAGKDTISGAQIMARCLTVFSVDIEHMSGGDGYCIHIKTLKDYRGSECTFELERFVTIEDLP